MSDSQYPSARRSVFVIGDSISIQYGPYLRARLEPWFVYSRKRGAAEALENLDHPAGANGGDSSLVLEYLLANDAHREIPQVDYLLVNCGLHDIKRDPETGESQVAIDSYRANLERIITAGRELSECFCWIRTTPCDERIHNSPGMTFHRYHADCLAYNEVADSLMSVRSVPVLDLFSFTCTLPGAETGEIYCDHVHFHEHVREKQAAFIAGWLCGRVGAGVGLP